MSQKQHWMDRAWDRYAHHGRWVLLLAIPAALAFFFKMAAIAFDAMDRGLWLGGMVACAIVFVAIAHLIGHYEKTKD